MAKSKKITEPKPEVLLIPIHRILPDDNQPRQSFDEQENIELAKSVAKDGILQPILVRPIIGKEPLNYMVVFGYRRLWAAKYNNMPNIPAQVRDLTDDEALHLQVIENLQRKNINPMEESDAFSRLINKKISTAEQLADELGVSTKYVYDRLSLQKVIDPVKEHIRKGIISISHGKQFARLKIEDQDKLWFEFFSHNLDEDGNPIVDTEVSVADVRTQINSTFSLKLEDAIFSTTDSELVSKAGSCEKCQKRSGCNLLLFDDIQQDDICFDKDCFQKKESAQIEKVIRNLEAKGNKVVKISISYNNDLPDDVIPYSQWNEVEEGEEHAIGVVVYAHLYSNYKKSQIVPVRLTAMETQEEGEDNEGQGYNYQDDDNQDDDDQPGNQSGISTLVEGKKQSGGYVDHNTQMQKAVIDAIVNSYKSDPGFEMIAIDIEPHLRKMIKEFINGLEDETAVMIAGELGYELTEQEKEEDNSYDIAKKVAAFIPKENLEKALLLVELVSDAEGYYDAEEIEEVEKSVSRIGISAKKIVEEYCEKTGYEF